MKLELKRDIYEELLKWKSRYNGKVLELKGARQTGKTFILNKFGKENYHIYIYINLEFLSPLFQFLHLFRIYFLI